MRKANRRQVLALGTSAAALGLLGAGKSKGPSLFGKKDEPPLKMEETVGDLAYVQASGQFQIEGVGLVVGLDGTGSEPGQSVYHQKLLNEMKKAQVPHPEQILARRDNSLVIVKGTVPMGITKDDAFDVKVELDPASATTSLAGGILLRTDLSYFALTEEGRRFDGKVLASAYGPVLTGSAEKPDDPRQGRVLGGARIKMEEVSYALVLKDNRRSVRNAALVSGIIGHRFFYLDGVNQKSMAQTKATDQYLVLKVPRNYHQNQARYFQVVQLLHIVDTPDLRAARMKRWGQELLDPQTSGRAAMKLEGLGRNAVEVLKTGLDSDNELVRYFSAEALAYLNDGSGAEELARAAEGLPEFRAFALAALAASDNAATLSKLRDLMANPDAEIRYGAFNALRAADPENSYLGHTRILRDHLPEPPEDPDAEEAMAFQIAMARAVRDRPEDPFDLYLVDCDGPPMVHVSNTRRCEIVVFGDRQRLLPPVVLGSPSSVLLNASQGDSSIQLARIVPEALDLADTKTTSSLVLGDVVREAANLGATYPQIVEILRMADHQKNLEGPLVVDAIPEAVSAYDQAQLAGIDPESKTDEAVTPAKAESKSEHRRFRLFQWFHRDRKK